MGLKNKQSSVQKKKGERQKEDKKQAKNSVAGQSRTCDIATASDGTSKITKESRGRADRQKHNERRKTYQSYPNPKIELSKRPKSNRPSSLIVFRTKTTIFHFG